MRREGKGKREKGKGKGKKGKGKSLTTKDTKEKVKRRKTKPLVGVRRGGRRYYGKGWRVALTR